MPHNYPLPNIYIYGRIKGTDPYDVVDVKMFPGYEARSVSVRIK
jgi:hypothetical protein